MTDHRSRRRRGRDSERIVAAYLRSEGWVGAEPAAAYEPGADVVGIPGISIECKARRKLDLPGWMRQAARRDGLPLLIVRGDGQGPAAVGEWTAAMPLGHLVQLLRDADY